MAVAWLTDKVIISTLQELHVKGIRIEVIVNDDEINRTQVNGIHELLESGVNIFYHSKVTGMMHHKFCIIDDSVLIMGSYNWTYSAAHNNEESIIIIKNEPEEIKPFIDEFETLKYKAINDLLISSNLKKGH